MNAADVSLLYTYDEKNRPTNESAGCVKYEAATTVIVITKIKRGALSRDTRRNNIRVTHVGDDAMYKIPPELYY